MLNYACIAIEDKNKQRQTVEDATRRFLARPGNAVKVIPFGRYTLPIVVSRYEIEEGE